MIEMIQQRIHSGEQMPEDVRQVGEYAALVRLLCFELGYGGIITEVTRSKVIVVTRIMNCVDTTIFTGPESEMRRVFEIASLWVLVKHDIGDRICQGMAQECCEKWPESVRGKALFVRNLGPILIGQHMTKVVFLTYSGIDNDDDVKAAVGFELNDIITAVELRDEGFCTFREALAAAA